jgi:1-acyl-sn-glycerol-3-phosphate acyltransferase
MITMPRRRPVAPFDRPTIGGMARMIYKSRLFASGFSFYTRWLLRRSFAEVAIHAEQPLLQPHTPQLFVANHSSWWDALVAFWLNETLFHADLYAMMSAEGLRTHPFFSKLGAFPIDRSDTGSVRTALRYTVDRLRAHGGVWLFPQGAVRHSDVRPLGFQRGTSWIVRQCMREHIAVSIVPIAISYVFGPSQHPSLYVTIAEAIPASDDAVDLAEQAVTAALDTTKRALLYDTPLPHVRSIAGRTSTGRPS